MIRILVVLMLAELIVVILLIDLRLDGIEDSIARTRASSAPIRTYHSPPEAERPHFMSVEMTGFAAPSDAEDEGATEATLRLTDQDRRDVIEELYRTERVWRRTSGMLQGVASLRKRELLPELDATQRGRIVQLTRDYVGRRVRIELAVMMSDYGDMDRLRAELDAFDRNEAGRIEKELGLFFDEAAAKQLTRLVVPQGQS
jgi:hypothetical protein